jgi:hypothetical protein
MMPRQATSKRAATKKSAKKPAKWSQLVTKTSNAMDLEPNVFKQRSAKKIAEAVERDAERSTRRKSSPYRSAMSMLTFYINRAGKNLSARFSKMPRMCFGPSLAPNHLRRRSVQAKKHSRGTERKGRAGRRARYLKGMRFSLLLLSI